MATGMLLSRFRTLEEYGMNVLIFATALPTKQHPLAGIFEFDQAKALAAGGIEVDYFAPAASNPFPGLRKYIGRLGIREGIRDGVRWHIIDIPGGRFSMWSNTYFYIQTWAMHRLYRNVYQKKSKPDIVHSHFLYMSCSASSIADKERIPLVLTEHLSTLNQEMIEPKILRYAKEVYAKADCLIAVSHPFADRLYAYTGIPSVVVPNIVDTNAFAKTKRIAGRNMFGFITVGNLIEIKRHCLLIDAFSELHKECPNVYLGIVGDGDLRQSLEDQVDRLGLRDCVRFYGQQTREQISDLFSKHDCFVFPSRSETFGVSCIEAMAAGLPVIASSCGGPEDFVTDETGILIPAENIDALRDAMLRMTRQAENYNSDTIRNYAVKRFSPSVIAGRLCDIYNQVLGCSCRP